jgi:hypothetical protein
VTHDRAIFPCYELGKRKRGERGKEEEERKRRRKKIRERTYFPHSGSKSSTNRPTKRIVASNSIATTKTIINR